jgi:membrane protease YdiL (CAAX protease family)
MSLVGRIRASPLAAFFLLAYALTWPLAALTPVNLGFALLSLFGPAAAAIIVSHALGGKAGVSGLLASVGIWRVAPVWYLIVFLLPLAVSGVVSLVAVATGRATGVHLTSLSPVGLVLFVLVLGEELGWRGFALPRMIERFGVGRASLLLGLLWGCWHFPTFFIKGAPQAEVSIVAYLGYTTALAGAFTWIWLHTGGSVLLATIFHGAVNLIGFTATGLAPGDRMWLTAGAWALAAILLLALGQERRAPMPAPMP